MPAVTSGHSQRRCGPLQPVKSLGPGPHDLQGFLEIRILFGIDYLPVAGGSQDTAGQQGFEARGQDCPAGGEFFVGFRDEFLLRRKGEQPV